MDSCEECTKKGIMCDQARPVCTGCKADRAAAAQEREEKKKKGEKVPNVPQVWPCVRLRAGVHASELADAYVTVGPGDTRHIEAYLRTVKPKKDLNQEMTKDETDTLRYVEQVMRTRKDTQVMRDLQELVAAGHITKMHDRSTSKRQSDECKANKEVCPADLLYFVSSDEGKLEQEFVDLWSKIELPSNERELRDKLNMLGHVKAEPHVVKVVAQRKERKRTVRRKKIKLTNQHLVDTYAWLDQPPADPK